MQPGLEFRPGPLAVALTHFQPAAERARAGLSTKDLATWSGDASERQKIGNRLGSLDATGRRALLIHLERPDARTLKEAFDALLNTQR